jgi:hypothetical protein
MFWTISEIYGSYNLRLSKFAGLASIDEKYVSVTKEVEKVKEKRKEYRLVYDKTDNRKKSFRMCIKEPQN